jgi:thioredoxin 1
MAKSVEINDTTFKEAVLNAKTPVLVDFWAPRCAPCRVIAPVIDDLANEYAGKIGFYRLNVDDNPRTASQFGVMSLPNLMVFKSGKPFSSLVGAHPRHELKEKLEAVL